MLDPGKKNQEKAPSRGTESVLNQKLQQKMQLQEESLQLKDAAVISMWNKLLGKGCGCAVAQRMSKSGSQEHICKIMLQLM